MTSTLAEYLAEHMTTPEEKFIEQFPHGFLLIAPATDEPIPIDRFQTTTAKEMLDLYHDGSDRMVVAKLTLTGGLRPYAMITIGRAQNNDVVLESQAISKFHAYLKIDGELGYELIDAGSRNGTVIDGQPLISREGRPLQGGETIVFGRRFECAYLTNIGFARLMRGLQFLRTRSVVSDESA